jgi:hypothetical protein
MTTPSGQIAVSNVNTEIGLSASYSSDLNFLNGKIKPSLRPSSPNMAAFQSKNYFQNTTEGACNNGNCQNNCNCGNIGGDNCFINGTVNCVNCDAQAYLQPGINCACTYNCTYTNSASHACNCTCACSKIICTKLYEIGMMPYNIFAADQQYGEWLKKHDRVVYKGYIKWARIVTSWIDGGGPDFMVWIRNKEKRAEAQKKAATDWAYKIATPWSEHMAYLMGAIKNDNVMGRIIMKIGRPICKIVYFMPKKRMVPDVVSTWTMWSLFFFSYYVSSTYVELSKKSKVLKNLITQEQ